jgi:hypothetical protein
MYAKNVPVMQYVSYLFWIIAKKEKKIVNLPLQLFVLMV